MTTHDATHHEQIERQTGQPCQDPVCLSYENHDDDDSDDETSALWGEKHAPRPIGAMVWDGRKVEVFRTPKETA